MDGPPPPWDHQASSFANSSLEDAHRSYLLAQLGIPSQAPSITSPTGHNQLLSRGYLSAVTDGTNASGSFPTTFAPTSMHPGGFPMPGQQNQMTAFGSDNSGAAGLHHSTTPSSQ